MGCQCQAMVESKIQPGCNIFLRYIDDITVIGTSAGKVNRDRELSAIDLSDANLRTEEK